MPHQILKLNVLFCCCFFASDWNQVLRQEWKCSCCSADRRCSNHIWVINNFIILYQRFDGKFWHRPMRDEENATRYCSQNALFTDLYWYSVNKANLRDLIAATGLVISNWIQIVNFSARVTVKFDGWPRKTIGHFFFTTSSFVHNFKSIGEFKLVLQSKNAQFGSKLVICYPVWRWNLMDDLGNNRAPFYPLQALCSIPETPNLGQIRRFLEPCDLVIWRMNLKNNSAYLLYCFKLGASFRSHWWI